MMGPGTGNQVVAHFQDGRVLKGTTQDFAPLKPSFHLFVDGDETGKPLTVPLGALKGLFFVKTYEGNRDREARYDFEQAKQQGRRIEVTFKDGETIKGFTMGYSKDKQGFFLIPADPEGNNLRVFIVNAATSKVEFPAPGSEMKKTG